METYIEYLNNSVNNTTESEFNNFLNGGGNINIDGGFPPVYECDSINENVVSSERNKERNVASIKKKSLASILDNRRKTPFLKISSQSNSVNRLTNVNSDSINDFDKKNDNIGGFLNLFESENNSVELPDNLSIISMSNNINNFDVISSTKSSIIIKDDIDTIDSSQKDMKLVDSIMLPEAIEVVNKSQIGGMDFDEPDSIMLPEAIEVINKSQIGGMDFDEVDSIMLPEAIEVINKSQSGGVIDSISSETELDSIHLDVINLN